MSYLSPSLHLEEEGYKGEKLHVLLFHTSRMGFLLVLFLTLNGCLAALAGPVEDRGNLLC